MTVISIGSFIIPIDCYIFPRGSTTTQVVFEAPVASHCSHGPDRLAKCEAYRRGVMRTTRQESILSADLLLPVVPHKAVAEVSRIGTYRIGWLL